MAKKHKNTKQEFGCVAIPTERDHIRLKLMSLVSGKTMRELIVEGIEHLETKYPLEYGNLEDE